MGRISQRGNSRSANRLAVNKNDPHAKDISILMTAFLMKIVGLWLAKDEKEQRTRDITMLYTVIAVLFGVWVQIRDFYYSWGNFGDCAYTACNILCLSMVLLKFFVVYVHRNKFTGLLSYTYKYFWHTNYDPNEKALLTECKRLCTLGLAWINMFAQGSVCSYILTPIVANIGKNESDRILPFNMWVDLPLSITPYYEIMFVLQVLSLYHVAICYICFDNLLCLLNLHIATQFRILQYRLLTLGGVTEGEDDDPAMEALSPNLARKCYASFKKCVQQHQAHIQYCMELENIFTVIVLGHLMVFSLLLCLVGYQTFVADSSTARRCIFIFHASGSMCQLLLFTYSCNGLIVESSNVGRAVYSGPWINLPMCKTGKSLRNDLKMVIIRSQKPCCLTASGFSTVSLETCTKVLSTAMSYFTLMRQSAN